MSSDDTAKVTPARLRRDAYLYIRQSTLYQVIHNTEPTGRQYDLKHRASALGRPEDRIHVIDTGQGRSGASAADLAGRHLMIVGVDDPNLDQRRRATVRAGPVEAQAGEGRHAHELGLAVPA